MDSSLLSETSSLYSSYCSGFNLLVPYYEKPLRKRCTLQESRPKWGCHFSMLLIMVKSDLLYQIKRMLKSHFRPKLVHSINVYFFLLLNLTISTLTLCPYHVILLLWPLPVTLNTNIRIFIHLFSRELDSCFFPSFLLRKQRTIDVDHCQGLTMLWLWLSGGIRTPGCVSDSMLEKLAVVN